MVDTTALQYLPVPQAQFATWQADLVRLENGWWPTGGAVDPANDGGIMNWQALILGERTEYLKHALGGIGDIAFTATSLNAIAETGIRNYVNGVTGNPLAGADGRVLHIEGAANASQMAVTSTGRMFWRIRTGASWSTWSEAVSVENGGDIEGDLSVAGLFSLDGTGEINGPVDVVGADAFLNFLSVSTEVDPAWKWYLDAVLTWTLFHETDGSLNFVLDPGAPDQGAEIKINDRRIWTDLGGVVDAIASLDALDLSGLYTYAAGVAGNPETGVAGRVTHTEGTANASQMVMSDTGKVYWRTRVGATWGTWSTAWAVQKGGVQSLVNGNGYERLPSGNIIQWGRAGGASNGDYIPFPIAFPNEVYGVTLGDRGLNIAPQNAHILGYDEFTLSLTGFDISVYRHDGVADSSGYTFIAIGR